MESIDFEAGMNFAGNKPVEYQKLTKKYEKKFSH